jgi:hypothetical protein
MLALVVIPMLPEEGGDGGRRRSNIDQYFGRK